MLLPCRLKPSLRAALGNRSYSHAPERELHMLWAGDDWSIEFSGKNRPPRFIELCFRRRD